MRPTFRFLSAPPVIRLVDASFRQNSTGPLLFRNLNFELPSNSVETWALLGGASEERGKLLNILRGSYQAFPPSSRSFPLLSSPEIAQKDPRLRSPHHAIQYVGFDAERGAASLRGAYLSARYESRREMTDYSLQDYLLGHTEPYAAQDLLYHPKNDLFEQVTHDLHLETLLDLPVSNLSNGQTRRAKIAKALLGNPEVMLLNSPFSTFLITRLSLFTPMLNSPLFSGS
jgi:ATPase subunit of ABC transporter with duplicated ATPase domains